MRESIVKKSSGSRIARRIGIAGLALATALTLGACKATGGGQIKDPVPSGVLPSTVPDVTGVFTGEANFGFNFTCEMRGRNKAVINGVVTYHDTGSSVVGPTKFGAVRLQGTVDPFFTTAANCEQAAQIFLNAAQFEGDYRSQEKRLAAALPGRFTVLVFDQDEPGRTNDPMFITGDGFAIDLKLGPYASYTRAGYITGGNIQVKNR